MVPDSLAGGDLETPCDILIIDDEHETAFIIKETLEVAGYCVRAAHSSEEALAVLKRHRPRVLVVDKILAPRQTGYSSDRPTGIDLASEIRQLSPRLDVKIVVFSAWLTGDDGNPAVDKWLNKWELPALVEWVAEVM